MDTDADRPRPVCRPDVHPGRPAARRGGDGRTGHHPHPGPARGSVADAFGTAAVLRSGDDILAQVRADRDEWGDR